MKRVFSIFLAYVAVCFFMPHDAFSAWTQPKGYAYNQLSLSHYYTKKRFTSLGTTDGSITRLHTGVHRAEAEEFHSTKITYYTEYGITDDLTIVFSVPWDWQRSNDTMNHVNEDGPSGVGDINLGVRQKLVDNILGSGVLMSVQGTLKIPPYEYKDPLEFLSLGDGQFDGKIELLFGRGLGKGYAVLSTAYVYRFENKRIEDRHFKPSDRFVVQINGGYSITSWFSLRGGVGFTKSLGNAEVDKELLVANYDHGGEAKHGDVVVVKDTLTLEPDILNAGIDFAFNLSKWLTFAKDKFPHKEIVFSYNRDLTGFGDLRTRDYSLGQSMSVAFVFPAEGVFPVNIFK